MQAGGGRLERSRGEATRAAGPWKRSATRHNRSSGSVDRDCFGSGRRVQPSRAPAPGRHFAMAPQLRRSVAVLILTVFAGIGERRRTAVMFDQADQLGSQVAVNELAQLEQLDPNTDSNN